MPASLPARTADHSLTGDLVHLLHRPARTYPLLFERDDAIAPLVFPAASGIYFMYAAAQTLALGNRFPFVAVAIVVVLIGQLLGIMALYFAGTLPAWHESILTTAEERERDRMFAVFGYATWPFLPLLVIAVPIDLMVYGTAVFSRPRPDGPPALVWGVRALELATILVWLVLMVKGTALAEHLSERQAARRLGRWAVELSVIGFLFLLIVLASVSYW